MRTDSQPLYNEAGIIKNSASGFHAQGPNQGSTKTGEGNRRA